MPSSGAIANLCNQAPTNLSQANQAPSGAACLDWAAGSIHTTVQLASVRGRGGDGSSPVGVCQSTGAGDEPSPPLPHAVGQPEQILIHMPHLAELADSFEGSRFYKHGAPDGAFACVRDRLGFLHLLAGRRYSPTWKRINCSISETPASTRMSNVFPRFHQTLPILLVRQGWRWLRSVAAL